MHEMINKSLTLLSTQLVAIPIMLQLLHDLSIYRYFMFLSKVDKLNLFPLMSEDDYKYPKHSKYIKNVINVIANGDYQQSNCDKFNLNKFTEELWKELEYVASVHNCQFGYHEIFGSLGVWSIPIWNIKFHISKNEKNISFYSEIKYIMILLDDEQVANIKNQSISITTLIELPRVIPSNFDANIVIEEFVRLMNIKCEIPIKEVVISVKYN